MKRESLDLQDRLEPLVLVVFLVTEERLVLLVLLVSLVLLVQMDSLDLRETRVKVDRRVMLVHRAPRGLLELQVLRDQLVCLDQKGLAVLKDLLVPQVSLEPLVELDLLVPMVTRVQQVLLVLLVKTVLRVCVVTVVLLEDQGMLACVGRLGLLERREILEKMGLTVRMGLQVLRVWLVSVGLLDFQDNVVKEVSLACLDPLVSLVNKELLEDLETVDPLDLWERRV